MRWENYGLLKFEFFENRRERKWDVELGVLDQTVKVCLEYFPQTGPKAQMIDRTPMRNLIFKFGFWAFGYRFEKEIQKYVKSSNLNYSFFFLIFFPPYAPSQV